MSAPLPALLAESSGPLGSTARIDLGVPHGPLGELAQLLSRVNGFTVFGAGVQVFRAGGEGFGPELENWNGPQVWKDTYDGLADGLFCFGQDVLGTQFAVHQDQVVAFDPETAEITEVVGSSLDDWATWLLDDPLVNGTAGLADQWELAHGRLGANERLVPLRFLALGGEVALGNLVVRDAVEAMRIRGPIAQQLHDLPDGAHVEFVDDDD